MSAVLEQEKPKVYKQPQVEVGQTVHWFPSMTPGDDAKPTAAIVINVGIETVDLSIFQMYSINTVFRAGVRHVTDPRNTRFLNSEGGTWSHTPFNKAIIDLMK